MEVEELNGDKVYTKISENWRRMTSFLQQSKYTVKPVLSDHSKIDKAKDLKSFGSFIQVISMQNAPIGAFCNTFDLH